MMSESRIAASYARLLHDYLRQRGLDPSAVLGSEALTTQHFVPMAMWQTWLAAVDDLEGRQPALGLRIAEGIRAQHFGAVGYAALACANLGEALQRLERFHASVYDANPAHLSALGDAVCIEWGVARGRPGALVDETGLASVVQLARDLVGKYIPVREVWFVNETPAELAPYRQFFGGEVRFEMPCTRLVLDAVWLAQPLRKSDPELLAMMDRQAEALLQLVSQVPSAIEAWRRSLVPLIREASPASWTSCSKRSRTRCRACSTPWSLTPRTTTTPATPHAAWPRCTSRRCSTAAT